MKGILCLAKIELLLLVKNKKGFKFSYILYVYLWQQSSWETWETGSRIRNPE